MITDLKINEEQKQLYYERGWWRDETIADVWAKQAACHKDKTFVTDDQGTSLTYKRIDEVSTRWRHGWYRSAYARETS